jgi:hypothetical protein
VNIVQNGTSWNQYYSFYNNQQTPQCQGAWRVNFPTNAVIHDGEVKTLFCRLYAESEDYLNHAFGLVTAAFNPPNGNWGSTGALINARMMMRNATGIPKITYRAGEGIFEVNAPPAGVWINVWLVVDRSAATDYCSMYYSTDTIAQTAVATNRNFYVATTADLTGFAAFAYEQYAVGGNLPRAESILRIDDIYVSDGVNLNVIPPAPARKAYNPTPTNGATIPTTSTVLKWYPGAYAAKHDVYLDTDFNDVNDATEGSHPGVTYYSYRQDANSYSAAGLTPSTTYYWRIDEVNGSPDYTIYKGKIWRFSIQSVKAYNPSPLNDANYIDPNADLSWSAGIKAKQHKVYFGTTHPLPPVSTQTATTYDPGKMAFDTLYFWRIDEVNDPNTWPGDEWEFRTRPLYVDANGGVGGNTVNADDGNPDNWQTTVTTSDGLWARRPMGNDPNYNLGTAVPADIFEASGAIPSNYTEDCMPLMTTIYGLVPGDKYDVSVVYWSPAGSANWNIQAGFTLDNMLFFDRTGQEGAAAGTPTGKTQADRAEYRGLIGRIQADINGKIQIYIDDKPATSNLDRTWYDGVIIAPAALTASNPSPHNGTINVELGVELTWEPGAKAQSHKVYFDPNIAKVQARKGCEVNGFSTTLPSYTPSSLELLTTYYWAIDEVNGSNTWKGDVWRFTTRGVDDFEPYTATGGTPPEADTLRRTWIDGRWPAEWNDYPGGLKTPGSSGSYAQLNTDTSDDATNTANVALGGTKSMKLYYDNDGTITWLPDLYGEDPYYTYTAPKYSEVSAAIDDAARLDSPNPPFDPAAQDSLGINRDWSSYKLLRIPVYGDPANTLAASEKLYVGLRDGDGTEVTIYNPDPNVLKQLFWQDWYIPLADFPAKNANLDLHNIARIYIGIGVRGNNAFNGGRGAVFFDDIQLLSTSICISGSVSGDFTNDCTVNAADLQRMTELWLGQMPTMPTPLIQLDASSTVFFGPVPKDFNWVNTGSLHGGFKDFNTLTLQDNPTVSIIEGKIAMVFDGNDILRGSMLAPASITGGNPFTVIYTVWNLTVDADEEVFSWAKRGTTARSAAVCYSSDVGWGAVAHWDLPYDMGFDRGTPAAHTWHTIGVTYKGGPNSVETVMVDGVVNATEVKTLNIWPSCPMTVGSAYDGNSYDPNVQITPIRPYSGALAKIEVYNVYVPPGNLAILMSTPIDMKKDSVINFRDIAIFARNWMLGPVLWP